MWLRCVRVLSSLDSWSPKTLSPSCGTTATKARKALSLTMVRTKGVLIHAPHPHNLDSREPPSHDPSPHNRDPRATLIHTRKSVVVRITVARLGGSRSRGLGSEESGSRESVIKFAWISGVDQCYKDQDGMPKDNTRGLVRYRMGQVSSTPIACLTHCS